MINYGLIKDKELIVRKRTASLIEKVYRFYGCDIRHDVFKGILYGETEPLEPLEEKIKNYYDAYMYLLYNARRTMTGELLQKLFYILKGAEVDKSRAVFITTHMFKSSDLPLEEGLADIALLIYGQMSDFDERDRVLLSLMFMNYTLVKHGIPTVHLLKNQIQKYVLLIKDNDISSLAAHLTEVVNNAKYQDKNFYKSLKSLSLDDVKNTILSERELLRDEYAVKHIYIFGSFAKGIERLDSDLDVVCELSCNLTYQEKLEKAEGLTKHFKDRFKRFADIHTMGEYLHDELIKQITPIQKIF